MPPIRALSPLRALEPLRSGLTAGSVLASAAALAATTAVAAGAFFLYGRRCLATGDPDRGLTRLRRAFRVGFPLVYVAAVVALAGAGWFDLLSGAVASLPGGETATADAVTPVLGLSVPAVAVVGAYLGAFPAVAELRDADVTGGTVARRLARYVGGLVGTAVLLVAVVAALGTDLSTGVGLLGTAAAIGVLAWAGSPWLVRLLRSTRPPTDAERERLDRLCSDVGLDTRSVRVLPVGDAKQAVAYLRGVPGRRHLFVSDYLLESVGDDRLRAYLALQAGRARVRHLEVRLVALVGTFVLAAGFAVGTVSVPAITGGVAAAAALAVGAGALWVGRRLVYRADADAAARTDPGTVATTIRAFADLNDAPMEWGRLTAVRRMEPPLASRIDRLRDRGADASDR